MIKNEKYINKKFFDILNKLKSIKKIKQITNEDNKFNNISNSTAYSLTTFYLSLWIY